MWKPLLKYMGSEEKKRKGARQEFRIPLTRYTHINKNKAFLHIRGIQHLVPRGHLHITNIHGRVTLFIFYRQHTIDFRGYS